MNGAMNGAALLRSGAAAETLALARLLSDDSAHWPQAEAEWEPLLATARRSMLLASLALRAQALGRLDAVPAGPRRHLQSAVRVAERLGLEVRGELARIAEVLQPAGLRPVLLKGAAYLAAGLPAAQGRLFADLDLIVPQDCLARAEQALFGGGWIAADTDAYNQRYYRQWMHEIPPLRHALRGSTIDLHHTITPPTSAFNVAGERLLARAVALSSACGEASAAALWMLQPEDMVLHSAVHLFAEGEFDHGLRDLLDMHLLLDHFARQDGGYWPRLLARAHELRLTAPLHHALVHAGRLFGTRPPAALAAQVQAMAPPWPQRQLMAALLACALNATPHDQRGRREGLARWLLYLRSHWLRMPLLLLVPHLLRKAWMRRFPSNVQALNPPQA